jgi:hypothetical protein
MALLFHSNTRLHTLLETCPAYNLLAQIVQKTQFLLVPLLHAEPSAQKKKTIPVTVGNASTCHIMLFSGIAWIVETFLLSLVLNYEQYVFPPLPQTNEFTVPP